MLNENPQLRYAEARRRLGVRMLKAAEMRSQEAAWFLLKQQMSQCIGGWCTYPRVCLRKGPTYETGVQKWNATSCSKILMSFFQTSSSNITRTDQQH